MLNGQEKVGAGFVLDVALGMAAGMSSVSAPEWQEVCGEHAARLREEYDAMIDRVRRECGDAPVDMEALRALAVEAELWSSLVDVVGGEETMSTCLSVLDMVEEDVMEAGLPAPESFPRPCGEVLDKARGMASSECLRRAHAEWDAEAVFLGQAWLGREAAEAEALRAVVRAFLWETAASGMASSDVETTDIVEDVSGGVALAVEDWVESGRVSSCPRCSVCPAGCAACVRGWLS